ncbi:hypothetical protein LCGC14_3158990 [marine sediment metagenome]|uniref:Core-binding (CB) domain-containing protein n=1 Tax=marine sediment metagenome TaxID=412755 RepID=A0A0F8WFV8_9ZZZZ
MTTYEIRTYGHYYKSILTRSGVAISETTLRAVNGLLDFLINLETIRELQEYPSAGTPFHSELIADESPIGEDGTR